VIALTGEELLVLGSKDCDMAAAAKMKRPAERMAI
jgi:hypothetical protein